jgi:vacuolar-type H+-ATPase subunit F/Vma7
MKKQDTSKREGQLVDQITKSKTIIEDLLKSNENEESNDMDISIIFITPDSIYKNGEEITRNKNTKAFKAFGELEDFLKQPEKETKDTLRSHIFWNNIRDENDEIISYKNYLPIEQILDNIIYSKDEDKPEPIPQYTIDTIKSFSNFIYSDFSYKYKKPMSGKGTAIPHEKFDEFKLKYQNDLSKNSWERINELCDTILELDNKLKVNHSLTHPLSFFYDYNNKEVNGTKIFSLTSVGAKNRSLCLHFIFNRNYQIDLVNDIKENFAKSECKYKDDTFGLIVSNIDKIPNESIIKIIKTQLDKIKAKYPTNE